MEKERKGIITTLLGKYAWKPAGTNNMALLVLRVAFLAVAGGVATFFYKVTESTNPIQVFMGMMFLAGGVIIIDIFTRRKRIEIISAIYFGLLVGMLLTYLLSMAISPLIQGWLGFGASAQELDNSINAVRLVLACIFCYGCISLLIQTKDDFRFVIPYVEFARDVKGMHPLILDTSSIIDGRLAELAETSILDSQLIMPQFVLAEIQSIADSADKLRRVRGRRGLDILNKLRTNEKLDFQLYDRDLPEFAGQPVDMKLVLLAKQLDGKLVTGDFNLNKVAKLHNVDVINLNAIANALRPSFLPGEGFQVRVVKAGEGQDQGIGYLDDGTMVVVEGGRDRIGQTIGVVVTSTLQTHSGRMIFTKYDDYVRAES